MQGKGVKSGIFNYNSFSKNKKGQVTIFIIIAVIVVAIISLIFVFWPKVKSQTSGVENPVAYIQACIYDDLQNSVEKVSLQGGNLEPEHYYLYQDNKIEYLCYINTDFEACTVQQPLLKQHIESEIKIAIENKVQSCFSDLEASYKDRDYDTSLTPGTTEVEILPGKIAVTLNHEFTLTKGETSKFVTFNVVVDKELYDLVKIATSIITWESSGQDVDTTVYMDYYPNIKPEKVVRGDGTHVYVLTNRDTEDKFYFATRGLVQPPGYGSINA